MVESGYNYKLITLSTQIGGKPTVYDPPYGLNTENENYRNEGIVTSPNRQDTSRKLESLARREVSHEAK